jgi:HPt (histidine-containing phosphotransfer) domain-containing protein
MIDQTKNSQPLDLSYLREMSGGSVEFMIEMLDAFKIQIPLYMADLEKAVLEKDWKSTSHFAHKVKPTFYYVGREDVRDCMQLIEHNARELKDIEVIPGVFKQANEFLAVLIEQIEEAKLILQKTA